MNLIEKNFFGLSFKIAEPGTIPITSPHYTHGSFDEVEPTLEIWCRGIKKGDVVVDAGAAFGYYTLPALAAGATVIAYEPWSDGRKILEINSQQNNFDQLTIRPYALWDGTPMCEELKQAEWGFHYKNDNLDVFTTTLDRDLISLGISRIDWIKLDIEGAELPALLGAQKILESRPSLIIEDHDGIAANIVGQYPASINSSNRIREMLQNLGYRVKTVPWNCGRKYIIARMP
jgi:FkbM family methyltransferase